MRLKVSKLKKKNTKKLEQLKNREKKLRRITSNQERKRRTHLLIERGAMLESFHFSISMISRGKGKSAVASAAYISCEKITNEWDGITHDYHNKQGLIYSEIFLPNNVPLELKDRATLWNSVELNEKTINS